MMPTSWDTTTALGRIRPSRKLVTIAFFATLSWGFGQAQTDPAWKVKQAWVNAHLSFLASDALSGRGSATNDERIAAEYIASVFEREGLQFAPGLPSYIQSADVTKPEFDGRAKLRVGDVTLEEGKDFNILVATATEVRGQAKLTTIEELQSGLKAPGGVLLVEGSHEGVGPRSLLGLARQAGAYAVLISSDDATRKYLDQHNGKTFSSLRLKASTPNPGAVIAVEPNAFERLKSSLPLEAELSIKQQLDANERKTFNAVGFLPGRQSDAGTILLSAHLDHLGHGPAVGGDDIYNGANDDASGVTAVLEIAHALAAGHRLRRNILFVCYGSEEEGDLGSQYFASHPPIPLSEIVANLEFEMIGVPDPKMPKDTLMLTGWERSTLGPALKLKGAPWGPDQYPQEHFFERSDNYALALQGVVAHTVSAWPLTPTYHQPNDDIEHIDIAFMTARIQGMIEPIRWLSNSTFTPKWNANGQPH